MRRMITTPSAVAMIGGVICLPFALLFSLLALHIEPRFWPFRPLLVNPDPDRPHILGSLIALGTVLLVIAGFSMNLVLIARTMRAGGRVTAHPANLVLTIATFAAIVLVVGAIIVDQYPCWIGVPNCD